jgi:hypothetical protein
MLPTAAADCGIRRQRYQTKPERIRGLSAHRKSALASCRHATTIVPYVVAGRRHLGRRLRTGPDDHRPLV